jgi:hypothetical protein
LSAIEAIAAGLLAAHVHEAGIPEVWLSDPANDPPTFVGSKIGVGEEL